MNHYWGSNETQSKCLSVSSLYTLQNDTKCLFCIKNMSAILQKIVNLLPLLLVYAEMLQYCYTLSATDGSSE
jgi:hypothetical protein